MIPLTLYSDDLAEEKGRFLPKNVTMTLSDEAIAGRDIMSKTLDVTRCLTRESRKVEVEFHLEDNSLPLNPIVKARMELLTEPQEIEAALQGYILPGATLSRNSLLLSQENDREKREKQDRVEKVHKKETEVDEKKIEEEEEEEVVKEASEVSIEGLVIVGLGTGLGEVKILFELEGSCGLHSQSHPAQECERSGMWTIKAPVCLMGNHSSKLTITVKAERLFKGDMDFNPPNNSQKLIVGRIICSVGDFFSELPKIQTVRISQRFPKISPLAASDGLAAMFGLTVTPPEILVNLRVIEDAKVSTLREKHARKYNAEKGTWEFW